MEGDVLGGELAFGNLDDVRVLGGEVVALARVGGEVIEAKGGFGGQAKCLPGAEAKGLGAAVLPVERLPGGTVGGGAAEQMGEQIAAVKSGGDGDSGGGTQRRIEVGEPSGRAEGEACGDLSGPPSDEGDADATFAELAFVAAKGAGGGEKGSVGAAVEGGAVVRGENHERGPRTPGGAVGGKEAADIAIEAGDHGGIGGAWATLGEITRLPTVRGLWEGVSVDLGFRRGKGYMRKWGGIEEKEGTVARGLGEVALGLGENAVGGVGAATVGGIGGGVGGVDALGKTLVGGEGGVVEGDAAVVVPKIRGPILMGVVLTVVTEEAVEALVEGTSGGIGAAEAPFAKAGGVVSRGAEAAGERVGALAEGPLAFAALGIILGALPVFADLGVAQMKAGEEGASGGCANGAGGIAIGEADALSGKAVDVRGADFGLTVTAKLIRAEVVGKDKQDVWAAGRRRGAKGGGATDTGEGGKERATGDGVGGKRRHGKALLSSLTVAIPRPSERWREERKSVCVPKDTANARPHPAHASRVMPLAPMIGGGEGGGGFCYTNGLCERVGRFSRPSGSRCGPTSRWGCWRST